MKVHVKCLHLYGTSVKSVRKINNRSKDPYLRSPKVEAENITDDTCKLITDDTCKIYLSKSMVPNDNMK